jgi:hypothetical protein
VAGSTAEGGKNRPNPAALAVDDALATLDSSAMVAVFQAETPSHYTVELPAPLSARGGRRFARIVRMAKKATSFKYLISVVGPTELESVTSTVSR